MARYLHDQAAERAQARSRLLGNYAPPLAQPTQTPQGVQLPPENSAGLEAIMQQLRDAMTPKGVKQTATPDLQVVPSLGTHGGGGGSSGWQGDSSGGAGGLGGILDNLLGKKGGLQQAVTQAGVPPGAHLRDMVTRGRSLSQPQPQVPGPYATGPAATDYVQSMIPGLKPGVDASKLPPGAPAAAAYMEGRRTDIPPITMVGKGTPPPAGTGPDARMAEGRDFGRVNPEFMQAAKDYAKIYAGSHPGTEVVFTSGYRSGAGEREHGKGNAFDMQLVKDGKPLENYHTGGGPANFPTYQEFANGFHSYLQQTNPTLAAQHRWGGYFSGGPGHYGALDLMHHDLAQQRIGTAGGSWEGGLTPAQAQIYGLQPGGGMKGQPPLAMPKPAGPALPPWDKGLPAQPDPNTQWPSPTATTPSDQIQARPVDTGPQTTAPAGGPATPAPAPGSSGAVSLGTGAMPSETVLGNKSIPAGDRFNNPFNMWHDGYANVHGGIPGRQITQFDTPAVFSNKEAGAAAAIQKMAQSPLYSGKTMQDMIGTWVGHGESYAPIIEQMTGISRNTPITPQFLASDKGIDFLKAMARYETKSQEPYKLTDEQWRKARDVALNNPPAVANSIDSRPAAASVKVASADGAVPVSPPVSPAAAEPPMPRPANTPESPAWLSETVTPNKAGTVDLKTEPASSAGAAAAATAQPAAATVTPAAAAPTPAAEVANIIAPKAPTPEEVFAGDKPVATEGAPTPAAPPAAAAPAPAAPAPAAAASVPLPPAPPRPAPTRPVPPAPQPPPAPAPPPAAAQVKKPLTGIDAARAIADKPFNTFLSKEDLAQMPSRYHGSTPREMASGMFGGAFMSQAEPLFNKFGFTRKDAEQVLREPPPKLGKQGMLDRPAETSSQLLAQGDQPDARTSAPGPQYAQADTGTRTDAGPQGRPEPTAQPQVTPEMAKALVTAIKTDELAPPLQPQPDAQPVMPATDVAPPIPGAPGGPLSLAPAGLGALTGGAAPMGMLPGSQGGGIAMAGMMPAPQSGVFSTPLLDAAAQQQQTIGAGSLAPFPWQEATNWGWGGGLSGGGLGGGFTGGDVGGGFSGGGLFPTSLGYGG